MTVRLILAKCVTGRGSETLEPSSRTMTATCGPIIDVSVFVSGRCCSVHVKCGLGLSSVSKHGGRRPVVLFRELVQRSVINGK